LKNPLQTLLMILALGLCGLCTYQWYREVNVRREITAVKQANYDQSVAIEGYTNSINTLDKQISQLDAHVTELRETVKSNNVVIFGLGEDKNRLGAQLEQYSNAVEVLQEQMKQANDSIKRQNESLKSLVTERDEYVKRMNDAMKERNDVVTQYNELVKRYEELQATGQPKKKSEK